MSGGTTEYVMGYLTTTMTPWGDPTWGATSSRNYSGFTSAPESKYYDAYTSTTTTTACNGGICYGQALSETSGWYSDTTYFVIEDFPWFMRGNQTCDDDYDNGGVFYFNMSVGRAFDFASFRSVILLPGE